VAQVKKFRGSTEGAKWHEIATLQSVIAFCHETIAKCERRIARLSSSHQEVKK
jgi:hypothetical protein